MNTRPLVLLVEDDVLLARAYMAFLSRLPCPCEPAHVASAGEALTFIAERKPDLLLLDLLLPDMHGIELMRVLNERGLSCPTIVVTVENTAEVAVNAMQAGALDYLLKPLSPERLVTTVRNTLEGLDLKARLHDYEAVLPDAGYEGFIGASPVMRVLYRLIGNAAASDASVFITGESGTGKDVCAEAIHNRGRRADKPLIAINCAAIPRELMESELFGHLRGAFTGADRNRDGAITLANGGTLFFDEICELNLDLQAKLLRFVESRAYKPVGGSRELASDVRIICATNRDPLEEVQAGRFREDLYYRLYVVPIALPPLRDRHEDILLLARHFLDLFAQEEGKAFDGFSAHAEAELLAYPWPGNVRQLQNVIRRIVVMQSGGTVDALMLPAVPPEQASQASAGSGSHATQIRPLWEQERTLIERAIALCGGNVIEAAARLGISDSTIYRKRARWRTEGAEPGNGTFRVNG
ncbi:MAG: sigma-54 dependent transcriptional regulator [Pseudomonadota bacterium]|nr:sigma-54 dependent transcriptional regulator [Pseudomonadota bacterium]